MSVGFNLILKLPLLLIAKYTQICKESLLTSGHGSFFFFGKQPKLQVGLLV